MSGRAADERAPLDSAEALPPEERAALRDLVLALADNKRLLGIRYADWMLGAPTLETGIAAASMAQDEWGHARLTYALLSDFGADPKHLEHEREAEAYHSMEVLDARFGAWTDVIAAALLLDTALTVQYGALVESRYAPVRNRVQKLLDEETFHFQYAVGWLERLATSGARADLTGSLRRFLPVALRWLGGADAPGLRSLEEQGVLREGPAGLRARFLQAVAPPLGAAGLAVEAGLVPDGSSWAPAVEIDWSGWHEARRRSGPGGPDADTLARVRGDRNRAALLE
jgi:ring-1,2-phenylacetyl-CoA epoxidase subunit PaaC